MDTGELWSTGHADYWKHAGKLISDIVESGRNGAARAAWHAHLARQHPELIASWRDADNLESITRQYLREVLAAEARAAEVHGLPVQAVFGAILTGPEWLKGDRQWAAVLGG